MIVSTLRSQSGLSPQSPPEEVIEFTGERFVPGVGGSIELEHLHRYLFARQACEGKVVLDIACGEGYGSAMLAEVATAVIGVDIAPEAIDHAKRNYVRPRLSFKVGSCAAIPLNDQSVDVVVSFETIEHHDQHEAMMREVRRVLRPNGLLIMSSPERFEYSERHDFKNEFHVRELDRQEFVDLLTRHFAHFAMYGQKVLFGSSIVADAVAAPAIGYHTEETGPRDGLARPVYLVAVASDGDVPLLSGGTYEQPLEQTSEWKFWIDTVEARDGSLREVNDERDRLRRDAALALDRRTRERSEHESVVASRERERDEALRSLTALRASAHADHVRLTAEWERESRYALELERSLHEQRAKVDEIYASTSWRLTRPMRQVRDALRSTSAAREHVLTYARRLYHRIPVTRNAKYQAKDMFFGTFGFAMRDSLHYRNWLRLRSVPDYQRPAQIVADIVPTADPGGDSTTSGSLPVVADGVKEWADLPSMRQLLHDRRAAARAFHPTVPSLEFVAEGSVLKAATLLRFPDVAAPTVSILVPVFNHASMTLECLQSIAAAKTEVSYEIVVADDTSTDETATMLALVEGIRVHRNENNLHFLQNCNAALPMVRGQYVVILNNDVQVRHGWLDAMLRVFDQHARVGAVGPKIVYPSGHLQEAGVRFRPDFSAELIGLNDDPDAAEYSFDRRVDYCSAACLMVRTDLMKRLGGFSDEFAPAYCEDADLCLRIADAGFGIYYAAGATVVHHLSSTKVAEDMPRKLQCITRNTARLAAKWSSSFEPGAVRSIAFYLPQFHPLPENDLWWGKGFTEWANVTKAKPNFEGHYQPHLPSDLGFYDLRLPEVMEEQARLARRYGIDGFCFYYYWFAGKRLLETPIERMLATGKPDFPFCLCWANENWTRRWDGQDREILMSQSHSDSDDVAVIHDLIRYFKSPQYIRVDGKPLISVYRVTLFPDFARTAALWREVCRREGVGEIYLAMVESFDLIHAGRDPKVFGCDAAIEFPPQEMAEQIPPSGPVTNPEFMGSVGDYRSLAARYAARATPPYVRFRSAMPGWDNTARRQNNSFTFEHATPGAFQAWLEFLFEQTRRLRHGDERIVFINAWNEWAEGAHLEPDRRFGHAFLEAHRNAKERESHVTRSIAFDQ